MLQLASQVNELATGTISLDDFNSLTTTGAINDALTKTTLPGSVTPPAGTPFYHTHILSSIDMGPSLALTALV